MQECMNGCINLHQRSIQKNIWSLKRPNGCLGNTVRTGQTCFLSILTTSGSRTSWARCGFQIVHRSQWILSSFLLSLYNHGAHVVCQDTQPQSSAPYGEQFLPAWLQVLPTWFLSTFALNRLFIVYYLYFFGSVSFCPSCKSKHHSCEWW